MLSVLSSVLCCYLRYIISVLLDIFATYRHVRHYSLRVGTDFEVPLRSYYRRYVTLLVVTVRSTLCPV